jgi:DNA-binding response OmpR family regulator
MSQLRRKLEDNPKKPKRLVSEPGVGYRFLIEA